MLFPTTYLGKFSFSTMTGINTKQRNRLNAEAATLLAFFSGGPHAIEDIPTFSTIYSFCRWRHVFRREIYIIESHWKIVEPYIVTSITTIFARKRRVPTSCSITLSWNIKVRQFSAIISFWFESWSRSFYLRCISRFLCYINPEWTVRYVFSQKCYENFIGANMLRNIGNWIWKIFIMIEPNISSFYCFMWIFYCNIDRSYYKWI